MKRFAILPPSKIEKGKKLQYVYNDAALESVKNELDAAGDEVYSVKRYKGLGEMNPGQLWETTLDPDIRVMKQVTIEDAEKAEEIFDILMGSEVEPRKRFIQTHAKSVQNLDI